MPHHRRHVPHSDDPKVAAYYQRLNKRADLEDHIFRRALHILERFIAVITIIGLIAALGFEIYNMFTRHLTHDLSGHGQSANTGVKDTDGRISMDGCRSFCHTVTS